MLPQGSLPEDFALVQRRNGERNPSTRTQFAMVKTEEMVSIMVGAIVSQIITPPGEIAYQAIKNERPKPCIKGGRGPLF